MLLCSMTKHEEHSREICYPSMHTAIFSWPSDSQDLELCKESPILHQVPVLFLSLYHHNQNSQFSKVCPMCRIPLANNLTSRNRLETFKTKRKSQNIVNCENPPPYHQTNCRQLEELARALTEEADGVSISPSAPPFPNNVTSSPPIPASVFTVTTSLNQN